MGYQILRTMVEDVFVSLAIPLYDVRIKLDVEIDIH
jgi:hypothetical protein